MRDLHQRTNLLEQCRVVTDRHGTVMCGRLGEPARHVVVGMHAELDRRLRVADLHDRPVGRFAFAADQLEFAVAGLRDVERRDWPGLTLASTETPVPCLP